MSLITRFSTLFAQNSRASLLILISIIALGFTAYGSLLQREGFPAIEFPVSFVRVAYFVGDTGKVDKDITRPIEKVLATVTEVEGVTTTTTKNFAVVVVQYKEGVTSKQGNKLVKAEIEDTAGLPGTAVAEYNEVNPASVDGQNDFLFSIAQPKLELKKLVKQANIIADTVVDIDGVTEVEVKSPFETRINPATGKKFEQRETFSRFTVENNDDELRFVPAVSIGVKLADNADVVKFSQALRAEMELLQDDDEIDLDLEFNYAGDISVSLNDQIQSLEQSTVAGLVVILIVTMLFINWRAAIVAALFIPTVLAATFLGLYVTGNTLNVISLFAMILVLGLFVDDAIVVIDAIEYEKRHGLKGLTAIKAAINKVGMADVLGTVTTMMVFTPMLAISGVLGEFITLIPFTVIMALAFSLLLALSIFVWVSNALLPEKSLRKTRNKVVDLLDQPGLWIEQAGAKVSEVVGGYLAETRSTAAVIVGSLFLVMIGGSAASMLSFDVFPSPKDSDEILVTIDFPDDSKLKKSEKTTKRVEKIILREFEDEIESAAYFSGDEDDALIQFTLVDTGSRSIKSPAIASSLNEEFEDFDDAIVKVATASAGPPQSDYPFQAQIFARRGKRLKTGTKAVKKFIEDYEYQTVQGETVEVDEVVIDNLTTIVKKDNRRFAEVKVAFSQDDTPTELIQDLQEELAKEFDEDELHRLGLADDALEFDQGVESDNLESFSSTLFAFQLALIVMYVMLVIFFDSFVRPLLVFMAIPFSFIGLFPGLLITSNSLSFFVMIGVIALAGIVVNNTIMLLDYANQRRVAGDKRHSSSESSCTGQV